jgi:hypothetical protein
MDTFENIAPPAALSAGWFTPNRSRMGTSFGSALLEL